VTHDLEIAMETADRFWLLNCGIPLISGIPEELVISGMINKLLPGDIFQFDPEKGRIEKKQNPQSWKFSGDPVFSFWVKKALEKAQIPLTSQVIQVEKSPFLIQFGDKRFTNLSDFITFLSK
jgi:iron complex transport system ATP-binding protein